MKRTRGIVLLVTLVIMVWGGSSFADNAVEVSPDSGENGSIVPLALEGTNNTFFGLDAGLTISGGGPGATGTQNTFIGRSVGQNTTSGNLNTFMGAGAGQSNTTASINTFIGASAGSNNTTGAENTFVGAVAGRDNSTGGSNTFIGRSAAQFNTTGSSNTFVGSSTGLNNTIGGLNTYVGRGAGLLNATASNNTFMGASAGQFNTAGDSNSFMGVQAGFNNTTGSFNAFIGRAAGVNNSTGNSNTIIGTGAGNSNQTGNGNVFLGFNAAGSETGSNKLYIDNSATTTPLIYGEFDNRLLTVNGNLEVIGPNNGLIRLSDNTTDNTTKGSRMVLRHFSNAQLPLYLFGAASTATANFIAFGGGNTIANAATQIDLFTASNTTTPVGTSRLTVIGNGNVGIGTQTPGQPLQMASGAHVTAGGVWTNASSREYKENIETLTQQEALDTLQGLNPVKFAYKADRTEKHVGFVAEEVPDLVATKERKGLSPMDIVAVLTRVVQEQQRLMDVQKENTDKQQTIIEDQQNMIGEQRKSFEEQKQTISALANELRELKRELRLRAGLLRIENLLR